MVTCGVNALSGGIRLREISPPPGGRLYRFSTENKPLSNSQ